MSEAQPNARYVQSSLANVAPTSTPRQRSFESGATELAQRFVGAELAAPAQLLAGLSAFDNLEVTCAIIVEADVDESRLQVVGGVDGTVRVEVGSAFLCPARCWSPIGIISSDGGRVASPTALRPRRPCSCLKRPLLRWSRRRSRSRIAAPSIS